jgi:hypothetical protein
MPTASVRGKLRANNIEAVPSDKKKPSASNESSSVDEVPRL